MGQFQAPRDRAADIVEELKANPLVTDITVERDRVSDYDIAFTHGGRDLPAGLLTFVGERADLRIEGTDGEHVHAIALV